MKRHQFNALVTDIAAKAIASMEADFDIEGVEINFQSYRESLEFAMWNTAKPVSTVAMAQFDTCIRYSIKEQRPDIYEKIWPKGRYDDNGNYYNPNP